MCKQRVVLQLIFAGLLTSVCFADAAYDSLRRQLDIAKEAGKAWQQAAEIYEKRLKDIATKHAETKVRSESDKQVEKRLNKLAAKQWEKGFKAMKSYKPKNPEESGVIAIDMVNRIRRQELESGTIVDAEMARRDLPVWEEQLRNAKNDVAIAKALARWYQSKAAQLQQELTKAKQQGVAPPTAPRNLRIEP